MSLKSKLKEIFGKEKPYDAAKFDEYFSSGVHVETRGSHHYTIYSETRKLDGEELEGAIIDSLGFFSPEELPRLRRFLHFEYKEDLIKLIRRESRAPAEGLVMLAAFEKNYAEKLNRSGVLTNPITKLWRLK